MHEGFSVITGETGAGKSIILGAIGLLLGNRADSKAIKPGCDRCVIEAQFDLSRYELEDFFLNHDIDYCPADTIIRRELTSAGKSRAFVNDTPVPLATMRELGETLVDIHSQHQNLLLQKEDFQLQVVDIIAGDKHLSKTTPKPSSPTSGKRENCVPRRRKRDASKTTRTTCAISITNWNKPNCKRANKRKWSKRHRP